MKHNSTPAPGSVRACFDMYRLLCCVCCTTMFFKFCFLFSRLCGGVSGFCSQMWLGGCSSMFLNGGGGLALACILPECRPKLILYPSGSLITLILPMVVCTQCTNHQEHIPSILSLFCYPCLKAQNSFFNLSPHHLVHLQFMTEDDLCLILWKL